MKRFLRNILVSGIALISATFAAPGAPAPVFRHITSREGLKFTWIQHIMRDSEDYLWFSSIYGAHRYNGHSFEDYTFEDHPGAAASIVNSVAEASDGSLLFSTGSGLWQLVPDTRERTRSLDSLDVRGVVEPAAGEIWAATNAGVFVREAGGAFRLLGSSAGMNVSSILQDSRGFIWVSVANGSLFRCDIHTRNFSKEADAHHYIRSLMEDGNHNIWLCTLGGGAMQYNIKASEMKVYDTASGYLESDLARQAAEGPDGTVWIATEQGIARILPDGTHDKIHADEGAYSLNDNALYAIYFDCDANLWVGTFFGGVNVAYSGDRMFTSVLSSEAEYAKDSKVVSDVIPHGDGLMVATENDGLFTLSRDGDVIAHIGIGQKGLKNDNIHSLCLDTRGNLWVGTYTGGLYQLPARAESFVNYRSSNSALTSDNIYCIRGDSRGNVWVGTQHGGLYRAEGGRLEKKTSILPGGLFVWDILEDAQGHLWFSCYGSGVWRLERPEDTGAQRLDLPVRNVISLCELSDGRILVSTEKEGVVIIDHTTLSGRHLTRESGFPDETVYCAQQASDGTIWMSTNHGLLKTTPDFTEYTRYTMNDGLPANRFNYNAGIRMGDNLLFGSTNGLVTVRTNQGGIGGRHHRLRFMNYRAGDPGTGNFSVEFSGNIYAHGGETFRYRMKGIDTLFHDLGPVNKVDFVGLPPGNYTLEVESVCEGDTSVGTLPVRIRPPWWQSIAAKILFTLLVLLVLGLILFLIYQGSVRNHELELEKLEREKEREINETKMRFIVNEPVSPAGITEDDGTLLREVTDYIIENISESDIDVGKVCSYVGMSRSSLYRKMKNLTGKSTGDFIQSIRMKYAAGLLSDEKKTVSEVAYAVGFTDPYYFSRAFKQVFGASPAKWRKQQNQH